MSERKTAEIKFRIEPSRKARWQAAAAAADISLSEWITLFVEDVLQQQTWTKQNLALDGNQLIDAAPPHDIVELDPSPSQFSTILSALPPASEETLERLNLPSYVEVGDLVRTPETGEAVVVTQQMIDAVDREHMLSKDCWCNPEVVSFAPQEDVSATQSVDTSDEVGSLEEKPAGVVDLVFDGLLIEYKPAPWTFEARNG
jgi:hypothetical protein